MSVYDGSDRRRTEAQAAKTREWVEGIRANGPTTVLEALVASAPVHQPKEKPAEPLDRFCLDHGGRGCGCGGSQ